MTQHLVSIVLPTHNGSRYLREAVQSCLCQTYPHWELIIVDDASTDETPELIAECVKTDSRIRSVRHTVNKKLPGALNTGFSLAKGQYLTWTSDDNRYRPNALAELVSFLENRPHTAFVYADYSEIDERGEVTRYVTVGDPVVLAAHDCVGACFLYRRCVLDKVGDYSEHLYLSEDFDYWLRVSVYFKLEPYHKDLYLYRLHGQSLTKLKTLGIQIATEQALEENLCRLPWLNSRRKANGYLLLASNALGRGDKASARRRLLIGVRRCPHYVLTARLYLVLAILAGQNMLLALRKMKSVFLGKKWRPFTP